MEYIGNISKYDYWDCFCLFRISEKIEIPSHITQLLVKDNNKMLEWWKKYNFNIIVCMCHCCHAVYPFVASESKKVHISYHAFWINSDDTLLFINGY